MSTLLMAVPHGGHVDPIVFARLFNQEDYGMNAVLVPWGDGYRIDEKRNEIACRAMAMGADSVLMVDSDVLLPADAVRNMLENDADVVLGYYPRKGDPDKTDVVRIGSHGYDDVMTLRELSPERQGGGPVEVKAGGMGCALIRTDVFRRMGGPWFDFADLSEDYGFCRRCRLMGARVVVDPRVRCGHLRMEAL